MYAAEAGPVGCTKLDLFNLWIVPKDDEEALDKGLLGINSRWDAFVHDELVPNYPSWAEKYATENPKFAKDILRLAPTLDLHPGQLGQVMEPATDIRPLARPGDRSSG